MADIDEQRLTDLEILVAHQEQTIAEMSDVIRNQWDEIDRLKRDVEKLDATKADIAEDGTAAEKPPHY